MSLRRLHVWLLVLAVLYHHTSSFQTSSIIPRGMEDGTATSSFSGQPSSRSSLTSQRLLTLQSPGQGPGQVFVKFSEVVCVEEEPDAFFSIHVGEMFTQVRGDGQLPEQFHETRLGNGGTVWRISGHECELRIAPTVGLPRSIIKSIWGMGVQEAIRHIYQDCVHQELRGGAQLWSWYGGDGAEPVIVEIALLKLRQDKTGLRNNPCVIC